VAEAVKADYGSIDILVHALANGPEVWSYLTDFLAVKRKYKKDAEQTYILSLKILSHYLISEELCSFHLL
jgi:enoyl-[acyl-carrier-protein] reductase (NADH)